MKRIAFLTAIIVCLCLTACKTGSFSSTGGQEDIAYIFITSGTEMAGKKVMVKVDNNAPFEAQVQKTEQNTEKHNGKLHAIMPGRRFLVVTYNGKTVYSKEIFLSSQQTKSIVL